MDLKIAYNDPQGMSQDGDAILRSLQNKSLPIVDLMVRESLQNSLDATLDNVNETIVDFKVGKFATKNFAPWLEGITENLLKKHNGINQYISISDKNTSGLTGSYTSNSQVDLDKSNFQKLVFGIGKNQNKDGAGGSWGLGKTSYFRMGIGLVVYYTRIKNQGSYEERLIVSLIESPKQSERLLKKSDRGIAWWGKNDIKTERIFPITDSWEISKFLNIFDLMPYRGKETGTTIIVPYVSDKNTMVNEEQSHVVPWEQNYESSIEMAVQRWYGPRIFNADYTKYTGNSMLRCSVNDVLISPINMEPTFEIVKFLYSLGAQPGKENEKYKVKPIYIPQKALENRKEPIGYVAFSLLTREDFKMIAPDNKLSPIEYIGSQDSVKAVKKVNSVMAYTRKPGMIVEYSVDGVWIPKNLNIDENHILFAFFVPNSKAKLSSMYVKRGYKTLEQYLRASENADHANWVDEDGITLIQRIQKYTYRAILEYFQDRGDEQASSAISGISRKVGQLVMPPSNFGKAATSKPKKSESGKKRANKTMHSGITVKASQPIDANHVQVSAKVTLRKESKNTLSIKLKTQDKSIDFKDWVKSMGTNTEFPIQVKSIHIKQLFNKKVNFDAMTFDQEYLSFAFKDNSRSAIEMIAKHNKSIEFECDIVLQFASNHYQPLISIKVESLEGGNQANGSIG